MRCKKLRYFIISLAINNDLIHHLKVGFLAHGLNLADDLPDKAFLNQLRRQLGVKNHRNLIVSVRYIALGLGHIDQQIFF